MEGLCFLGMGSTILGSRRHRRARPLMATAVVLLAGCQAIISLRIIHLSRKIELARQVAFKAAWQIESLTRVVDHVLGDDWNE